MTLCANDRQITTYALLDTGSSTTFISTSLARQLALRGNSRPMRVAWADSQVHEIQSERLNLVFGSGEVNGNGFAAQTMDDLALPRHRMTSEMAAMEGFQDR